MKKFDDMYVEKMIEYMYDGLIYISNKISVFTNLCYKDDEYIGILKPGNKNFTISIYKIDGVVFNESYILTYYPESKSIYIVNSTIDKIVFEIFNGETLRDEIDKDVLNTISDIISQLNKNMIY